jgi:hypothetical protein
MCDGLECQNGPRAAKERVNNTREGKTKLKALARENNKQSNLQNTGLLVCTGKQKLAFGLVFWFGIGYSVAA